MATGAYALLPANVRANIKGTGVQRVQAELQTGFIDQYSGTNPADCAQAGPVNRATYSDSGMGLLGDLAQNSTTGAKISAAIDTGLKAIPVVGQFLSQVWNKVNPFVAHAQAVAKEQGTLCTLIPQVNATLAATDAAVKSGQLSAVDADAQLESMVAAFEQGTSGITKDSGGTCNAGCVMRAVVREEATLHEQGYRTSPIYYLKKYWWVAAIAFVVYIFVGER